MQNQMDAGKQQNDRAGVSGHGHAANDGPAPHPVVQLQQLAGNQAVQALLRSGWIQAKLAISSPDDPEEREADQMAHTIMRAHAGAPASHCSCAGGEEMCEECQQEAQGSIRRHASAVETPSHVPQIVRNVLGSPGQPLDPVTRTFFEPRFGRDFGNVRVHTDSLAAESARSINAHAYTAGSDMVFGSGQYSPDTASGRTLLAHELTHVVQQRGFPSAKHAQVSPGRNYSGPPIQRQASEPAARTNITREYAAGLSNSDLDKNILALVAHARDVSPSDPEYAVLLENLTILLKERGARTAGQEQPYGSLPQLMVDWHAAGLLDPPYRPREIGSIPPLPLTAKQAQSLGPAPIAAGMALPKLLPPEPVPPPPTAPPLRLVPPAEPVPVEPVAPVEVPPVVEPVPPTVPAAVPILVAVAILLWPSETAPAWADELSPITGGPYSGKEEYDWTNRLTPEQRDYLRRLVPYRRVKPDPSLDEDPDPTIVPTPQPVPKPKEKEKPKPCISSDVPRRGGYPRHDAYATKVTGSVSDYYVRTPVGLAINYDGLEAPLLVWEVKVGHGWFFNPDYAALRDLTLAKWDAQKSVGLAVAAACHYLHLWTIPDAWVAGLLNTRWGGVPPVLSIPE